MSESYWNKRPVVETTNIFSPNISNSLNRMPVNKDLALPIVTKV